MSTESHSLELSATEVLFVERQCSRFEDAWKAWRSRPRSIAGLDCLRGRIALPLRG